MKYATLVLIYLISLAAHAQLYVQRDAEVYLQKNSSLFVQGEMVSYSAITGHGAVYLTGDAVQRLDMNGFNVPLLSIQNKQGIDLTGNLAIDEKLIFNQGVLRLNNSNLELNEGAVIHVEGDGEIFTNSTGIIRKRFDADVQHYFIPLANANGSAPVILSAKGKYHNGYIEIMSVAKPSPNKPADVEEYLNSHWKINRNGVDGGVEVIIQYEKLKSINYSNKLSGYVFENLAWNKVIDNSDHANKIIRTQIQNGISEVYAMNKKESLSNIKSLLVPNPAIHKTKLVITSMKNEPGEIVVTDSRGRVVQVQKINLIEGLNHFDIQVINLPNGYYDVTIILSGKRTSLKLIKQ